MIVTTYQIGGGDAFYNDQRIVVWDAVTGEYLNTLVGPTLLSVVWSPDSKLLASDNGDALLIWDVEAAELRTALVFGEPDMSSIENILWSPDGQWIAASDHRDTAIFNVETGERLSPMVSKGLFAGWSPYNSVYAVLDDSGLIIRDILSGMELGKMAGVSDAAAFSQDWTTFYGWIGTRDSTLVYSWPELANSTLRAWNVGTGEQRNIIVTGTRWVQSIS